MTDTAISTPATWTAGVTGDWSNAANWAGGVAPTAVDDVVVPGASLSGTGGTDVNVTGAQQAVSLTVDSSTEGQDAFAEVEVAGSLTLSGALTLTSNPNVGSSAAVGLANGAVLTASSGISIDANGLLYNWDGVSGTTWTATVNAAIQNNGVIQVGQDSDLTINGSITGTGTIAFNGDDTLTLNGATNETFQFLDGATLALAQPANFTGTLFLSPGTGSLNLEGGSSFGGSMDFTNTSDTLDLVGVATTSVKASGSQLQLAEANGQTLDLTAYLFPNGYPGNFNAATYQLPAGYAPVVTSDGNGGTLISFVPTTQTWIAGAEGNWEDPNNWTAGRIPDSFANVVFSGDSPGAGIFSVATIGAPETIASLTENFSGAGQSGGVDIDSSLLVTGNVTLQSNSATSGQGARIDLHNGAVLTAGGLIDIGQNSFVETVADGATDGTATINGAVQDDGFILLSQNTDLVINGNITGGGAIELIGANATLELSGASNVTVDFSFPSSSTLKLDQAASVTSQLVIYSGSSATLNLSGASSFGGTLDFYSTAATLDLAGIATQSFTFSGSHLHIVETDGQTLDLTAYLSPLGYAIDPSAYQLPAGYGLTATSDGNGGTLLSFVQGTTATWIGGGEGDWSEAGNWQSGLVPGPADTIVTSNGQNLIDVTMAVQAGSLEDKGAGVKVKGGALTLVGALTVDAGSSFQFLDGGSLTAGSVTIGQSGYLQASVDYSIGEPSAVVNANVENDGTLYVDNFAGLVINGNLTGSGFVSPLGYGATLELGGADTQDILLTNSSTLILDDASAVTGSIDVRGNETLNLKGSTGFGGALNILGIGTSLDLVGVTAASLSGTDLHVTEASGQTLDLTTFLAADGILGDVAPAGPTYSLVTNSDGNGGTLVSFQSTVEHAPIANNGQISVDLENSQSPASFSLRGYDQDYDPLTVVSVQSVGSTNAPTSIATTPGQMTSVQGLYGTLSVDTAGDAVYSPNLGAMSGVIGQHPVEAFQFTISDGRGGTATGTEDISINRAPTANNDSATVTGTTLSVDAAHGVLANDTDPDGDALQVVGVGTNGAPSNSPSDTIYGTYGTLVLNADGSYVYTVTNAPTVAGAQDIFTYAISDEGPAFGQNPYSLPQATLDISVPLTAAPPAPSLTLTSLGTGAAPAVSGTAQAGATITLDDGATSIGTTTADPVTGAFSITGTGLGAGEHILTATATDSSGNVSTASSPLTIEVGTAATIAAELDALQSKSGLAAIVLTDTSLLPVASVAAMNQLITADAAALAAIQGGYGFAITASSSATASRVLTYNAAGQLTATINTSYNQGVITSQTTSFPDGSSDAQTFTAGILTNDVFTYKPGSANLSDTKSYTGGNVTRETIVHNDKSKDVYISAIQNQSYVSEHDSYNATGTLTAVLRQHADGSTAYTYALASNGTKTTDQYNSAGSLTSDTVAPPDGSSDTKYYTNGALTSETLYFAPASLDQSESRTFTVGVLTQDIIVHKGNSRDIYYYNIQNRSYTSEHDVYNAAGTLTSYTRTHADGTNAATFVLDASGTKTTNQYDATGVLLSNSIMRADGSSDSSTYNAGVIAYETIIFVPGSANVSETKAYTAGVLTRDTVVHAGGAKDTSTFGITGQSYVSEQDSYSATGALTATTRKHADGSLAYTYNVSASGTKTTDQYNATGVITSETIQNPDGSSDYKSYLAGLLSSESITFAPGSANLSEAKVYTAGVLTRDTLVHAGGSKDISIFGITGQSFVSEQDSYSATGALTAVVRKHADGSLAYTYSVSASGSKTTDQYNATGVISSESIQNMDGSNDYKSYVAGLLSYDTMNFAPGSADVSDLKLYTAGVLSRDTLTLAGGAKTISTFGITGQSYVAEQDSYNAAGTLTATVRTHADGSLAYSYNVSASGTKTTDQYNASGVITSASIQNPDGSTDTKAYSAGVLSTDTQVHADKSKDVFSYNLAGQPGASEHDTYNSAGSLTTTDVTNADGSHKIGLFAAGLTLTSNTGVVDSFSNSGPGSDTFVFNPSFGEDVISGFHAGAGANHDVIQIGSATLNQFSDLVGLMTPSGAGGADTLITIDPTDTILLKHVTTSSLTAQNFAFTHVA